MRVNDTNKIVRMLSGGTDDGFAVQAAGVVKSSPKEVRENIIKKLNSTTTIPAEHVAAMKSCHNIPWNLMREIRCWLKEFNVQLSSEGKVRKVAEEWVGKGLESKYAPLLKKKGKKSVVVPTPWCYIFNLVGHILALNNLNVMHLLRIHLSQLMRYMLNLVVTMVVAHSSHHIR